MSPANFVVMGSRAKERVEAQFNRVSARISWAIACMEGAYSSGSVQTVSSSGTGVPMPVNPYGLAPVVAR